MGAVYLAVRDDDTFEKCVAIKFIRRAMDSARVREAFHVERRILARLEHPNIARVLDAGEAPDGTPYLVMEFVQGDDIATHAGKQGMSIRERVQLFVKVCDAVQYLHQNFVVHRDLKPGNILIDENGTPRLLDFGVAKILELPSLQDTLPPTLMRMMTPSYASPEQFRGETTGVPSDIYGLGAILYELLCGGPAFRLETTSMAEAERVVNAGLAEKPSTRALQHGRELRGDLDNIVLKAMRPNPRERYATAAGLAGDLNRYLRGEPVSARDYRAWERAWKFTCRHRTASLAAAAVAASLVAGVAMASFWVVRANREREVAVTQRHRAEVAMSEAALQTRAAIAARTLAESRMESELRTMSQVLTDVWKMHGLPGNDPGRRASLEKASRTLEQLRLESPANTQIQFLLGSVWHQLGHLMARDLGGPDNEKRGVQLLRQARTQLAELWQGGPPPAGTLAMLVETLTDLGHILTENRETLREGDAAYREAEQLSRAELKRAPGDASRLMLAEVLGCKVLASVQNSPGKMKPEEIHAYRTLLEKEYTNSPDPDRITELANIIAAEGKAYSALGQHKEALVQFETVLPLRQRALDLEPLDKGAISSLNATYSSLMAEHRALEGAGSASLEPLAEKMVALAERLSADPKDREGQIALSASLLRLGAARVLKGRMQEALEPEERGLGILRKLLAAGEKSVHLRRSFAGYSSTLANIYQYLKRPDDAMASLNEGLQVGEALARANDASPFTYYYTGNLLMDIARIHADRGNRDGVGLADRAVVWYQQAATVSPDPTFLAFHAEAVGRAAQVYAKLAGSSDSALAGKAREMAMRSLELASPLTPQQKLQWSATDQARVRALAVR